LTAGPSAEDEAFVRPEADREKGMNLASTGSIVLLRSATLALAAAVVCAPPARAGGAIIWSEQAVDPEGGIVRAIGTDADGGAARFLAARVTADGIDQSTFVFIERRRQLVIERVAGPYGTSLSARSGGDRLAMDLLADPLRHGFILRYTLPDGMRLEYQLAAGGAASGDRAALRRALDRHGALVEQVTAFLAATGDLDIGSSLARAGIPAPSLEFAGKYGDYHRCLDECANECGLHCAAECNLGLLDPAGILCGLCKTSCLAGCTIGCSHMWSRE
jgi:hypothetical protein